MFVVKNDRKVKRYLQLKNEKCMKIENLQKKYIYMREDMESGREHTD